MFHKITVNIVFHWVSCIPSRASTIHKVIEVLPSKPGKNCNSTDLASILDTARLYGGEGNSEIDRQEFMTQPESNNYFKKYLKIQELFESKTNIC
jgi:hypothetical protein